ncbi:MULTISPECIES: hypothetical protein [Leptolyngbya]|uniref:hypothetical protein n=1 Tax=Leptolyngbya TaxID=47251 RepID=UPI0016862ED2|nr:hypothetical protein [Leptolyngbya sp. FACHB-1624]MBD1858596.1 hypothetical protein [Leptolyngbya sp. FACHB-1624]
MINVLIDGNTVINIENFTEAKVDMRSKDLAIDIEWAGGKKRRVVGDKALEVWQKLVPGVDPPPRPEVRKVGRSIAAAPLKTI